MRYACGMAGVEISALEVRRPSLEDVYLRLTAAQSPRAGGEESGV